MNKKKNMEKLGDKFLSDLPLETPSVDFSEKIMRQITQNQTDTSYFVYKPLISTWGWAAIFASIVAVICYSINTSTPDATISQFEWLHAEIEGFSLTFPIMQLPEIPKIFFIPTLVFSLMAIFEISLIKRFFDRRATQ